jgi:hypothetical protein
MIFPLVPLAWHWANMTDGIFSEGGNKTSSQEGHRKSTKEPLRRGHLSAALPLPRFRQLPDLERSPKRRWLRSEQKHENFSLHLSGEIE